MNTLAVLSMLHEPADLNSATRSFRTQSVLWWTLARLSAARGVSATTVLCFDDQLDAVRTSVGQSGTHAHAVGPRRPLPQLDAITAASRWLDGWRGGLLQSSTFDPGFHAPSLLQLATSNTQQVAIDSLLLVDPSSALVDPTLVTSLLQHAIANPDQQMVFSQAAPGLSGVVLRLPLLNDLAKTHTHPGKLLAYLQDRPGKDPIALASCAPVPTAIARTTHNFKLNSRRQALRLSQQFESLNGQLITSPADALLPLASNDIDPIPREITLELTPRRNTVPTWLARDRNGVVPHLTSIGRDDLSLGVAESLFSQLSTFDDTRITLAGVGDPLLHPQILEILASARSHNLRAIHVETDLVGVSPELIDAIPAAGVDILSVHLPAVAPETYHKVMGVDAYVQVLDNVKRLVQRRHELGLSTPIIVPTFMKLAVNLHEMELFYDQWLRVLGSAVIQGPSDAAGQLVDLSVANMAPPKRRPCARLQNRLTILSDGRVTLCENDVLGNHTVGSLTATPITDLWQQAMAPVRSAHAQGNWAAHPLCANCKDWHRP